MRIYTTIVPSAPDILRKNPILLVNTDYGAARYSHRVTFKAITTGAGVVARVDVPQQGNIGSVAVLLKDAAPSGKLIVTPVSPDVSYDGAFLYAVLDDVPVSTVGPAMWRKTEIKNAYYSSLQSNLGVLYFIITGGPTADTEADIALTAITD